MDQTFELVPHLATGRLVVSFSADIPDSLAGTTLHTFTVEVTPRGATTGGPVIQSGNSYIAFPHLIERP